MGYVEKTRNEYQYVVGDAKFLFSIGRLFTLFPENNEMISHSHLHEEIIYVINGKMEIQTEDSSIFLNCGDVALIPANLIHNTCCEEVTHYISVGFIIEKRKVNTTHSYFEDFSKLKKENIVIVNDFDKFHCFDRIAFYLRCGYEDSDQLIISCLQEMIFLIKNALLETKSEMQKPEKSGFTEYQYSFIDHYISVNYNKEPSLSELSKLTYISTQQLQRIIKKLYHQSFTERILFLKMENAKRLLKNSDISVEEVATKVGYDSSKSFFKAFKKTFGVTPNQYRKSKKLS